MESFHLNSNKLKLIINHEISRYQQKGLNLLIGILLAYILISTPNLLKQFYPYLPYTNLILIQGIGVIIVNISLKLSCNLLIYLLYISKFSYFEQFRISQDPWPWEKNPSEFRALLLKTLKQLAINGLIVSPVFSLLLLALFGSEVQVSPEKFPDQWELTWQLIFCMMVADTYNYWSHRLMHSPYFYKKSHKVHHEFVVSVSIAAEYFTPAEHLLSNCIQTGLGPMLLGFRCHIVTFYLWIAFQTIEPADAHSGYDFPWSPFRLLPFSGGADYHDFHHSHNVGNFASYFTYWDTICGTNEHYWRYFEKKQKIT
jgi:sterol desaturase/sphingolipid hydroxylase (fatty acid hydroxylase superfamily)